MISIIIPAYKEATSLPEMLKQLKNITFTEFEVILILTEPDQQTQSLLTHYTPNYRLKTFIIQEKGRGIALRFGAEKARGTIYLFLHCDTHINNTHIAEIHHSLSNTSIIGGAFEIAFDNQKRMYRIIECYLNTRSKIFKQYHGDQAIFIRKNIYNAIGGIPAVPLMEDVIFSNTMKKTGNTSLLQPPVTTSARRVEENGVIKIVYTYFLLKFLYICGVHPHILASIYNKLKSRK